VLKNLKDFMNEFFVVVYFTPSREDLGKMNSRNLWSLRLPLHNNHHILLFIPSRGECTWVKRTQGETEQIQYNPHCLWLHLHEHLFWLSWIYPYSRSIQCWAPNIDTVHISGNLHTGFSLIPWTEEHIGWSYNLV